MNYKLRKVEIVFDKDGKMAHITTTAEMPDNCEDVRRVRAEKKEDFWGLYFNKYESDLVVLFQKVTAFGDEI